MLLFWEDQKMKLDRARIYWDIHTQHWMERFHAFRWCKRVANTLMKNKQIRTSAFPGTTVSSWLNRESQWKELCHSEWSDTAHNVFHGNPNQKIQCIASGSFFNWLRLNFIKALFCNLKKSRIPVELRILTSKTVLKPALNCSQQRAGF